MAISPRGALSGSEVASESVVNWLGCRNSAIISRSVGVQCRLDTGLNGIGIPDAATSFWAAWDRWDAFVAHTTRWGIAICRE
jgi:hypothetical protein